MFKKFLVISMSLFVVILVSGCNKKETQVPKQEEKQPVVQENPSQEIEEQVETKEETQQKEFILPDMNQESWETYTDEAWGFSIKFPKELYYRVHPQGEKYPGEECMTCGNGGQLLIISDQEEMGIQDYSVDEKVRIVIISDRWNKSEKLKETINANHINSDDGNQLIEVEVRENSINDYLIKTDLENKKYPHGGAFYNKHLFSSNFKRDMVRENWEYSVVGGTTFVIGEEEVDQRRIDLIESIISTFKFTK